MRYDDLKDRTKSFALCVIEMVESLPSSRTAEVIGNQLTRSATSVGANYRAACRARSGADFVAKMGIVEEEADECIYWMELLIESGLVSRDRLIDLITEASELVAITVASIKTARGGTRNDRYRVRNSEFGMRNKKIQKVLVSQPATRDPQSKERV